MEGKVVIITGATSGIGRATALGLAMMGATLVLPVRNMDKGEAVRKEILEFTGNESIYIMKCDLASMSSIRTFCAEFKSKCHRLDVLINNAGTWDFSRKVSKDGIENIFATNYLAPFLMTNLLLDVLEKSVPSRIISLSSGMHMGAINFNDIEFEEGFLGRKAYAQSKLAIILFTRKLARDLAGSGVTVNCVHPGLIDTDLGRDSGAIVNATFKLIGKDVNKGAETPLYLASDPKGEKVSGEYWYKKQIKRSSKQSYDEEMGNKLWAVSKEYTGVG